MTHDSYSEMQDFRFDVAIVGGGIAGLWLLNRLSQIGYSVVLFEKETLGAGQTLASQGIVHGGLKYALNGVLSPASSAIAEMPARWARCLDGQGDIDLRATRRLSEHYYMWSGGSMRSRLKTFLGSKALRGRIDPLPAADYPAFMNPFGTNDPVKGVIYRLPDFVVDTPSLLENLAAPWRERIFRCPDLSIDTLTDQGCRLNLGDERTTVECHRLILCAGEGNEELLKSSGLDPAGATHPDPTGRPPAMQRRPLHMAAVRIASPSPAYLHCIGDSFGMTPLLTITGHPTHQPDEWIWYLGGELAESGVERNSGEQIMAAHDTLTALFPWLPVPPAGPQTETGQPRWHTFFVNRAEPQVHDLKRPDTAYVEQRRSLLVCWPTKLTLCPDLGDTVLSILSRQLDTPAADSPATAAALGRLRLQLPAATVGTAPWEHLR